MKDARTARYCDERIPRYTSYPTAPHFSARVTGADYRRWLRGLPSGLSGSLYVHIPFCRSMCWYCGCNTTVSLRSAPIEAYLESLRLEIARVAGDILVPLPISHVHFGGGTPTIVSPEAFIGLMRLLSTHFDIRGDAEVAVEIDPRVLTQAMTDALACAGVNRASLGVQSFDPAVQQAISRIQGFEETARAVSRLRASGVRGISLDLIYGLPHQSVESCRDTVRRCLDLKPERLSVFGYAHVPAFKKHQRKIDAAALPDGAARRAQAEAIAGALEAAGYIRIGLDHFARPDDAMAQAFKAAALRRNFQGYTTDAADALLGFGASAIGRLPQGHVQNDALLAGYREKITRGDLATARGLALSAEDLLRGEIIERIMCDFEVDVEDVCRAHGVSAGALMAHAPRLRQLQDDGLVELEGAHLSVPEEARDFVRLVASAFDAYLDPAAKLYSRAV